MAIEGIGATITKDAAAIGEVVDINLPDDSVKEYETTTLGDTREVFKMSAMSVGQEFSLTIRLNPESPALAKGDSGAYVITLPKQTSGSAAGATYTFNAFCRDVTGGTASTSGTEGITQDATYRLTGEVAVVDEA
tara:strand:+ start:3718 stop:4122 length:405 start_codon:yes stop_codon:yes gene_type:complete